jgi:hypothetical protein
MLPVLLAAPALLLGAGPIVSSQRHPALLLSATDSAFGASHTSFYTDAVRALARPFPFMKGSVR